MRIIFAGRDNPFNRRLIQEFSIHHEVLCCLFLEPERVSWEGKWKMIRRRIKRQGITKTADQLAFHLFDRLFLRKNESLFWKQRAEYCDTSIQLNCPVHQVHNIHAKQWIELCKQLKPDVILATCSQVIFKPELYTIPSMGTYIIHEGLTPEYKGLHTSLWALMKKEFEYIGYTILKANDKIDGGEILMQTTYTPGPAEDYRSWSWIGHHAIISGVDDILFCFNELERERCFTPIDIKGRKSGYYTWMGISDFVGLYMKNYWRITSAKRSYNTGENKGVLLKADTENRVFH